MLTGLPGFELQFKKQTSEMQTQENICVRFLQAVETQVLHSPLCTRTCPETQDGQNCVPLPCDQSLCTPSHQSVNFMVTRAISQ